VELFVIGGNGPIWRETIMRDRAAREIQLLSFPYFIPESDDMIALPIVMR
jgi:hypothetical protein